MAFDFGDYTSKVFNKGTASTTVTAITWILIILVVCMIVGVLTYWIITKLKYNKKLVIFEKVGGHIIPTRKDKAMEIVLGLAGDTVFWAKKNKKYLARPTIQTGKRTYWYYIREDGEWINIGIADIDEQMREVKAFFLDKEMRYARVGLQRNFKERYQKIGFLDKYGGILAYTVLIAVTGIMMWLLFSKWIEGMGVGNTVMDKAAEILDSLGHLKCIQTGGGTASSGVVPAG